jgi:hypothetical protein
MEKLTQTLTLAKSTKNTHVYEADESLGPAIVRSLYVSKWAFGQVAVPKRVTIDINEDSVDTRSV